MYRMFYEWSNFTPISTGVGLIEVFLEVPSPASWWVYRICVISTELVSRGRARGTFSKPKPKIFGSIETQSKYQDYYRTNIERANMSFDLNQNHFQPTNDNSEIVS